MIDSPERLDAYLHVLRKHGVTSAKLGDITLELGHAPTAPGGKPLPEVFEDGCRCGHPLYEHNGDAGCLHGCPLVACVSLGEEV